jgi:hypothetical protein
VFDVHIHVGDRRDWHPAAAKLLTTFEGNHGTVQWDADGRVDVAALLDHLTAQGVAHAALIPADADPVSFSTIDIAARGEGRLHPFVSIDPRTVAHAASLLDEAFGRAGLSA